jgi:hypothetical protein
MGIEGSSLRLGDLMKRIRQKEFRKRTQGKCLFSISPQSQIGLKFYSTIMPAKKPAAMRVNKENNKECKTTTKYLCKESG